MVGQAGVGPGPVVGQAGVGPDPVVRQAGVGPRPMVGQAANTKSTFFFHEQGRRESSRRETAWKLTGISIRVFLDGSPDSNKNHKCPKTVSHMSKKSFPYDPKNVVHVTQKSFPCYQN